MTNYSPTELNPSSSQPVERSTDDYTGSPEHRLAPSHRAPRRMGRKALVSLTTAGALFAGNHITSGVFSHDEQRNNIIQVQPKTTDIEAGNPQLDKPRVELSPTGPYFGPDVAKRQQDFNNPDLSAKENMEFGLLDAEQLKRDGVDFMFAKTSQGTEFEDVYFAENRSRAEKAGLLFGAYHFLEPGNGKAQADHFYNKLIETGGVEGVMLMLDVEWADEDEGRGADYEDVTAFCDHLHELVPDRKIIIYTLGNYWGKETKPGHLGNPPAPEGTVLNWASYVSETEVAPVKEILNKVAPQGSESDPYADAQVGTWKSYTFRQFTANATYGQFQNQRLSNPDAGQGTMDFSVAYSRDDLLALAGLSDEDK